MSVKVIFMRPVVTSWECIAELGQTLLTLGQGKGFDLQGMCGGQMACATCHVIVDPAWFGKLPQPSQDEFDMLDLAPERVRASGLACQIKLAAELDGLAVRLLK